MGYSYLSDIEEVICVCPSNDMEKMLKNTSLVALDKIEKQRQLIAKLEAQLDRRDCDWEQERRAFESKIEQLERREEQLENGWRDAEKRYEKQITGLEKQIPPKYDPEKQYTKEQITEIMQAACDIMNLLPASSCKIMDFKNVGLSVYDGKNMITDSVKYHNHIAAPEKGRVVMVRYKNPDKTLMLISNGLLDQYGNLMCDCALIKDADHERGWAEWCDYLYRSHHSTGWNREWEPDYR